MGYRKSSGRQYVLQRRKTLLKVKARGKVKGKSKTPVSKRPEFHSLLKEISGLEYGNFIGEDVAYFLKKLEAVGLVRKIEFEKPDTLYITLDSAKRISGQQMADLLCKALSLNPDEYWIERKGKKTTVIGFWWD